MELQDKIRQNRLYLQAQDNQIQRNLDLLKKQDQQQRANKAAITRQEKRLNALVTDAEAVIERLRQEAEATPSQRFQDLEKRCSIAQEELKRYVAQSEEIAAALEDSLAQLHKLDDEIIGLDALHEELKEKIRQARFRLQATLLRHDAQQRHLERVTQETTEAEHKLDQMKLLTAALKTDQEVIAQEITQKQVERDRIVNEIRDKQMELETLETNMQSVTKSLEALIKKDKDFRRNLAGEKLSLERGQQDLKIAKEALKRDTEIRQQIEPNWKPRPVGEPEHFAL